MRLFSTLLLSVFALCVSMTAQTTKSLQQLKSVQSISLQFETIPNAKEINKLQQMGVSLSTYLGDNTYEVVLAPTADLKGAQDLFSATESSKVKAYQGIVEDIKAKHVPSHASHNNGTVDIAVTFSEELNQATINAFLLDNKGTLIRNISNGQVIIFNVIQRRRCSYLKL